MKVLEPKGLADEHCDLLEVYDDIRKDIDFIALLLDDVTCL